MNKVIYLWPSIEKKTMGYRWSVVRSVVEYEMLSVEVVSGGWSLFRSLAKWKANSYMDLEKKMSQKTTYVLGEIKEPGF